MNLGLLGELHIELRLVESGWHPIRLDSARMAENADLLALKQRRRLAIQVKTTDAEAKHSHSNCLFFGYATGYLSKKSSIFNAKNSPILSDLIVGVSYHSDRVSFVVMPVAFAETLCRLHCDYWKSVPKRHGEAKRSDSFPIYLRFTGQPGTHEEHHARVKRNLLAFEEAWNMLSEPIERLHDAKAWPLLP